MIAPYLAGYMEMTPAFFFLDNRFWRVRE